MATPGFQWSVSCCISFNEYCMITSSNENIFRVTGPFWGESTGHRWIPLTNGSDAEFWCLLWSAPEQTVDLRRHRALYDVTVTWWGSDEFKLLVLNLLSSESCLLIYCHRPIIYPAYVRNWKKKWIMRNAIWFEREIWCSGRDIFSIGPKTNDLWFYRSCNMFTDPTECCNQWPFIDNTS